MNDKIRNLSSKREMEITLYQNDEAPVMLLRDCHPGFLGTQPLNYNGKVVFRCY